MFAGFAVTVQMTDFAGDFGAFETIHRLRQSLEGSVARPFLDGKSPFFCCESNEEDAAAILARFSTTADNEATGSTWDVAIRPFTLWVTPQLLSRIQLFRETVVEQVISIPPSAAAPTQEKRMPSVRMHLSEVCLISNIPPAPGTDRDGFKYLVATFAGHPPWPAAGAMRSPTLAQALFQSAGDPMLALAWRLGGSCHASILISAAAVRLIGARQPVSEGFEIRSKLYSYTLAAIEPAGAVPPLDSALTHVLSAHLLA